MTTIEFDFAPPRDPVLSVAVLLTRGPDLVEPCLSSIAVARSTAPPSDVVLVLASDDAQTRELVRERVRGATVIEAPAGLNVGLGPAQNLMFANARGRWVVLLHEDSQPSPGAFEALVAAAEAEPAAAVVGARLVTGHGDLQQAGAVLWSDGRVTPVAGDAGRDRVAAATPYAIDACGMAGTLVERAAWQAIGGFDERFFPAYSGDVDFCLAVWGHGRSVLCEPRAVIRHDRGAMVDRSRGATGSLELRSFLGARQHGRFASKWAGALGSFSDAPDATREREAAAVENAIVRSGAARAARAGLLGARQDRSITRPDGHADAVAIDGAVEARLLRAQVGLLRDFADHLHEAATRQPVRPVRLASAARPRVPSAEDASAFIDRAGFQWGQRWELAPGVFTPGGYDVSWLLGAIGLPADLTGASVLDVGTGNGVAAFEAERRGATRVVAVDGPPPDAFGVGAIAELLGSRVEYLQAPAYEVAALLGGERFDVVLCLGLLPHLRHPLLALDALRSVTAGELLIETAVSDHELDEPGQPLARFYRRDELGGDPTNWLAPTSAGLLAWCASCGFSAELAGEWPPGRPERVAVRCRPSPGIPEWQRLGAA